MSNTIAYLTSRSNFVQVSPNVPITKQRNAEKFDSPDIFEGAHIPVPPAYKDQTFDSGYAANQKELVTDLVAKAKQVEYLIQSLPEPESEEEQVRPHCRPWLAYLD